MSGFEGTTQHLIRRQTRGSDGSLWLEEYGLMLRHGSSLQLIAKGTSVLNECFESDPEKDFERWKRRGVEGGNGRGGDGGMHPYYFLLEDPALDGDIAVQVVLRTVMDGCTAGSATRVLPLGPRIIIDYLFTPVRHRGKGLATLLVKTAINIAQMFSANCYVLAIEKSVPYWIERGFVLEEGAELQARLNIFSDTYLLRLQSDPIDPGQPSDLALALSSEESDDGGGSADGGRNDDELEDEVDGENDNDDEQENEKSDGAEEEEEEEQEELRRAIQLSLAEAPAAGAATDTSTNKSSVGWYPYRSRTEEAHSVESSTKEQEQNQKSRDGESPAKQDAERKNMWPTGLKYFSANDWESVDEDLLAKIRRRSIRGVSMRLLPSDHVLKGQYGLFATLRFQRYDVIGEYTGVVVDENSSGHFVAGFDDLNLSVDAEECGSELRFINSYLNIAFTPNVAMRTVFIDTLPRIIVLCIEDIEVGDELLLDYGEAYNKAYLTPKA